MNRERWRTFSLAQQWGHVGSEIGRARGCLSRGDVEFARAALQRGLDMIDAMLADEKSGHSKKEPLIFRGIVANILDEKSTPPVDLSYLEQYCNQFALNDRLNR